MARTLSHGEMINKLWPDKALFGAVMLFVTGLLGVAFAALTASVEMSFSEKVPSFLRNYPDLLASTLSLATLILAGASLRQRSTTWALWGTVTGFASFGMLGVGSLLSLVALGFLLRSRAEGEDYTPDTLRLTADQWPDKSLAASLLLLMAGIVALVWGGLLIARFLSLELGHSLLFGQLALLSGLVCLAAASQVYYQRAWWLGALAGLTALATFAFYAIGPLLGLGAIVLLTLAYREREFDPATTRAPDPTRKATR